MIPKISQSSLSNLVHFPKKRMPYEIEKNCRSSKLLPLKLVERRRNSNLGSRLQCAEFLFFPPRRLIVLPCKDWITTLIVKSYHEVCNYVCRTNYNLASLSSSYWILCCREEIRDWENVRNARRERASLQPN